MNISTKLLKAAAGQAGGAGLDVDEVFKTHLYTGTYPSLVITNNIDLSGEGGLVWIKERTGNSLGYHVFFDTERGADSSGYFKALYPNVTNAEGASTGLTSFSSNGFTVGDNAITNGNNSEYVSWTFRKAPKFFDIVTYTGNGSTQNISHSLGSVPGMVIIKTLGSLGSDWFVWHRGVGNTGYLVLNGTAAKANYSNWLNPTSTTISLQNDSTNVNGESFVAYFFAHNDSGDGGFGPDGDQDIIKCGSYTGNGSSTGTVVNLGFEPQLLIIKRAVGGTGPWAVADSMRGVTADGEISLLRWNASTAEATGVSRVGFTSTGFQLKNSDSDFNNNGDTYIYMAIRRGPLAAPEDATKVFSVNETGTGDSPTNSWPIGFNADMIINAQYTGTSSRYNLARSTGRKFIFNNSTAVEQSASASSELFFSSDGVLDLNTSFWGGTSGIINWAWKRAPSYFDVCCYTGTGTAGLTVNHNLGVAPEMTWVKRRDSATNWRVNVAALGTNGQDSPVLRLNLSNASEDDNGSYFGNNNSGGYAAPTSSVLTLGGHGDVNASGGTYIAYLFATVAGVSKVGSYTGTGSTQTIDCGFSSGARFVLIKCTNDAENWIVFDSVRGIVSGNDPYLALNTTDAQTTTQDLIDPVSSGFAVNTNFGEVNNSSNTYIFYAIA